MGLIPKSSYILVPKFSIVSDLSMNVKVHAFSEFLASNDTLRVYKGDKLIFASSRERLLPLIEYIDKFTQHEKDVTVFDRVVGNAAALLLKRISCKEAYSALGSEIATGTLSSFGISYHFDETVPYIKNNSGDDMCPMEKLSLSKDPEEFYQVLKERIHSNMLERGE